MKQPLGRDYRLLWTASTISNIGDGVVIAAFPLLAVTLTRDPRLIAGTAVAAGLPWLLFSLVSGALVDRWNRRTVMTLVDLFRTVAYTALGIAVVFDRASLPLLYAVAFCVGTAETLFDNAAQALMPSLVSRERLESANARLYAAEIVTNQFAGPPLGSFLFVAAAASPFLLDAGSFLVAALLVLSIRRVPPERVAERRSLRAEIGEGVRWLWRHPVLRTLALMLGTWNLVGTAGVSVFVLFALDVLGVGARGFGVLLAVTAAGGLLGTTVASKISSRFGPARALIAMMTIGALTYLPFIFTSSVWLVGAGLLIEGAVGVIWNVITVSLRQSLIPPQLLGRVNSVYRFVGWGTISIGGLVGGSLARAFGLRAPYVVAACVLGLLVVLAPVRLNRRAIDDARREDRPE